MAVVHSFLLFCRRFLFLRVFLEVVVTTAVKAVVAAVKTVVAAVKAAKEEAEFAALSFLSFDIAGIL